MSAVEASRVLIVEDDSMVRSFLSRALETGGYEPVAARTGEEARSMLGARDAIAVALIDGMLPDMHGMRLAREIIESAPPDPVGVCFVTGSITASTAPVAGVGALSKPLRVAHLLATVGDLLSWRAGGGSPQAERLEALERFEDAFAVGP